MYYLVEGQWNISWKLKYYRTSLKEEEAPGNLGTLLLGCLNLIPNYLVLESFFTYKMRRVEPPHDIFDF